MKLEKICILGGTGFVGHHLTTRLAREGREITVLSRRPQRHRDLAVSPGVRLVEAQIHKPEQLRRHFEGHNAVVNLVGILNEFPGRGITFRRLHVELAKTVVEAAHACGVQRLLHMSALNADEARGSSVYLRSKGLAENHTQLAGKPDIGVTSFRPSVIFGPDDAFFNRFAQLLRRTPWLFPLACPNARFAPVYVGDVAAAFDKALESPGTFGQHYELCGPRAFTLQQLVEYTARTLNLRRQVVGLSDGLSRLQARLLQHMPGKPFSMDNYDSLKQPSLCHENGLQSLGLRATDIAEVVPSYLSHQQTRSHYVQFRALAGRDL